MATVVDKLQDLDYNELATLQLIEKNKDLLELFYSESNVKFPMIYQLQKEDKLSEAIKEFTKMIFDSLIVTKQDFINKYRQIENSLNSDATNDAVVEAVMQAESVVEVETVPVVEDKPKAEKAEKPKKEKALPRRYGKQSILQDIAKQGGVATSQQRAGLKVADLKNIYVNLERRLINDMLTENAKLTVEDYRLITATIEIVETKLKEILKKK